ncbi:bacillithiol biosynthesis deacetylase BshB2 [Paenibacillus sp. FSL W8-0187]|jgi:N-acetylglucosamine malate deacetylase 2|uniref:Bacillithiol biosynthesis deacetylase BshB2 n=1 Tax=Paenibacillus lautus TaxID=1401 RepID=A0A1R1B668_PAELA|nr:MULTISPECIES: bacillithiol biosynthesis deacetylase BshB2 [Paenibacillus]MBT2764359.1 bacillithiol biosynthesis deacetylase BshB2 [Paenibacillus sp. ISL-20]OME94998.1 bacillithiol biosynthesis deacetylase BshB2 [Paenibacillus lautus]GIO96787.1 bacillithiol biosynthesis deacetylase BshB2 [Paenibacillus lautus]
MEQNILVILPHPDDEAFGLSGTLAKYIMEGAHVTYACLTLGEMGRNMGIPPFANRITLPTIRKAELEESCKAIGIQDLRLLGFHDKTIEFEDQNKLDSAIASLLQEIKPSLVFTFYPGYSVHPDHDATGAAVIRTIQRMPAGDRPVVQCLAFSNNCEQELGKPDVYQDVSMFMVQKLNSIQAHRSQFQAAELLGKKQMKAKEVEQRFGTERFWTYTFE